MLRLPTASVDLDGLTLQRDGVEHVLTAQEAELLRYLAERSDGPVARQELLTEVWGYAPQVVTRAIDATVSRLRAKLEPDPRKPRSLVSVRGKGYRLHVLAPEPDPATRPATRTSLVGREQEHRAIASLLDDVGVVQLVGPGGAGKTTLARALSDERGGHFIDLSTARTVEEVPTAVAHALRLPLSRDDAAATWRRIAHVLADAPALLVLDNLEQLPEATAELLQALWKETGAPLVLTSRRALVPTWPSVLVGPMEPDDARTLLVRAARRVAPNWSPDDDDVLGELVEAVDRLPLALELVGVRLPALGAHALLPRIRELQHVGDGRAGRHASLATTVAWSWTQLCPVDRRRLAWWSVFRGAIPTEAAMAVAPAAADARWGDGAPAGGDAFATMLRLQDASLLDPSRRGGLRLWVAVRAFAGEQLSDHGEREDAERAHAQWLLSQLPASPGLLGGAARTSAEVWVMEHRADLAAAVEHQLPRDPDLGLRLGLGLMAATRRMVLADARRVYDLLAPLVDRCTDPELIVRGHLAFVRLQRHQPKGGAWEDRLDRAREVLDTQCDHVDPRQLARLDAAWHQLLANRMRRDGDLDAAIERYRIARGFAEQAGDRFRHALLDHDEGAALRRRGDYDEAYILIMRSLAAHRSQGNRRYEALGLQSLASVRRQQGHPEHAAQLGEQAIAVARRSDDPFSLAEALANHGNALTQLGRVDEAEAVLREAVDLQRSLGNMVALSFGLGNLGAVREQQGDEVDAELLIQEALEVATAAGVPYAAAFWQLRLGQIAHGRGDVRTADLHYGPAVAALDKHHAWPHSGFARAFAAIAAAELGRPDEALAHLGVSDRLRGDGGLAAQAAAAADALVTFHRGATTAAALARFEELGGRVEAVRDEPLLRPVRLLWVRAFGDDC